MRSALFPIVWRLVLTVSLVTAPLAPMAAPEHARLAEAVSVQAPMPCHEIPAPAPVADAPCDDGCCPLPDCDPGACRVPGAMLDLSFALVPAPHSATLMVPAHAGTATGPPAGVPLRPPIA